MAGTLFRPMSARLEEFAINESGVTNKFERYLMQIISNKARVFPALKKISMYWIRDDRYSDNGRDPWWSEEAFLKPLRKVGVKYF